MIDNGLLVQLQDEWIKTQSPAIFNKLYIGCLEVAEMCIRTELKKRGSYLTADKLQERKHDATTLFLEQLIKRHKEGWRCNFFKARIRLDVLKAMYAKEYREMQHATASLEEDHYIDTEDREEEKDPWTVLIEGKYGRVILLETQHALNYKAFILNCSLYIPKLWLYNNAVELKKLFKHTRIRWRKV
jgi:hypothetical protein